MTELFVYSLCVNMVQLLMIFILDAENAYLKKEKKEEDFYD